MNSVVRIVRHRFRASPRLRSLAPSRIARAWREDLENARPIIHGAAPEGLSTPHEPTPSGIDDEQPNLAADAAETAREARLHTNTNHRLSGQVGPMNGDRTFGPKRGPRRYANSATRTTDPMAQMTASTAARVATGRRVPRPRVIL